jgi:hypothetical protein
MAKLAKGIKPTRIRKSRSKKVTQPVEEITTATKSRTAVAQPEVAAVEIHQPVHAVATPTTLVTESGKPAVTRSDAAKANIKEGLRLHQIAGRPTKQQLILVFGKAGYLLTWPKRTERFGIRPETFQAALAKGVPAIRLGPGAQTVVEEAKETA